MNSNENKQATTLPALTSFSFANDNVFQSTLKIVTTKKENQEAGAFQVEALMIEFNVQWVEQCQGCGREIIQQNDNDNTPPVLSLLTLHENPQTRRVRVDLGYCSHACAQHQGAPALAKASREWAQSPQNSGQSLEGTREDSFWQVVWKDYIARQTLSEQGGWRWEIENGHPLLCAKGNKKDAPGE